MGYSFFLSCSFYQHLKIITDLKSVSITVNGISFYRNHADDLGHHFKNFSLATSLIMFCFRVLEYFM